MSPIRSALLVLCASLAVSALSAQTGSPTTAASADTSAPGPTVEANASRSSPWDISTTIRASLGSRSNVAVSAFHPVERAFWRGEAESFILRPLGSHAEFVSFLSADVLRYFDPPPGVTGEQELIAHLEGRWTPTTWLRAALKADGFAESTFIDPSQTEGRLEIPVWVRVRGGYATFAPRLTLPMGFSVEPSVQVKRITYHGYNGDYDELRPGARLEWKRADWLVLSAAWYEHTRHYRSIVQVSRGNKPKPGWLLSLHQREGELKVASSFAAHGTWSVAASVGRLENRDRAFGFLDYNQDRGQLDVSWAAGAWRVTASGEAKRLDYLVQTVGSGISVPPRITDIFDTTLRLERDLSSRWAVFLENRWERNRSNVVDDTGAQPFSYRLNTVSAGVQRSF